jgi:hypothetical protein
VKELFLEFVSAPGPETFLAVRSAVVADPAYQPYGDDLDELTELVERGAFTEVGPRFQQGLPTLLLSPRAHFLASAAAGELGDDETAQMERHLLFLCAQGILGTGDGSRERPYLVTSTTDEYSILGILRLAPVGQSLLSDGDRRLDEQRCEDGTVVYFDVTDMMAVLARQIR